METKINVRNPTAVRIAGLNALKYELGIVGTVYFLRQFTMGQGDYTAERETLLQEITLEDIIINVHELDSRKI
jgi:hypothetical protein